MVSQIFSAHLYLHLNNPQASSVFVGFGLDSFFCCLLGLRDHYYGSDHFVGGKIIVAVVDSNFGSSCRPFFGKIS